MLQQLIRSIPISFFGNETCPIIENKLYSHELFIDENYKVNLEVKLIARHIFAK